MTVQPGATLLHYRLLEKIGAGGMGEVWRARDTTLDRDVAIKLLPGVFASDTERLARFEREAKVLASLNHPQIAAIHGFHEANGHRFLALELVPGEDLAARIARGAIPVDEAIAIARKVAAALEYAHERGIVHRDLKPANTKITPEGDVKVLDFGLAKAVAGDLSSSSPTSTPTMMTATVTGIATAAGLLLGTAAYMSPEQARGKPVDKRADNWAFGCLLYEMLTGHQLFDGETVTDVLAAVVTRDPDWTRLPTSTPSSVRRLLARCLEKDPRTRLRDIGEARIALERGADEPALPPSVVPQRSARRWWATAAVLMAMTAGIAIGRYVLAPARAPVPSYEFDVTVPGRNIEPGMFALSPDGSRLALVVRETSGDALLAVRELSAVDVRVLSGTNGATTPFWSPDGREIAYFSGNQLLRIAVDGAAPRLVATIQDPRGGAWGPRDVILAGSLGGPIVRLPASGGAKPEAVTTFEAGSEAHAWPAFLPDGRRFIYERDSFATDGHQICLASLDGGPTTILKKSIRSQGVVDPSGRLLIGERGQLVAYPFDLKSGVVGSDTTMLSAHIYPGGNQHHIAVSVSTNGVMATQETSADVNLVLLDKAGRVTRTIGEPARYGNPRVSRNGKRVAYELFTDVDERYVWAQDLDRGVRVPVSVRGRQADGTAWMPDSETVVFDSSASGTWEIFRRAVSGGGDPENLGSPPGDPYLLDVSPDGRWVLTTTQGASKSGYALYIRSLDAGGKWAPWSSDQASDGSFSPDSRWIAYTTDASGRAEVYVAPLEGGPSAHRWPISSNGGFEPRFSPDGKMLYYRSPVFDWMAVDITLGRDTVVAGTPKKLFSLPPIDVPYVRNVMDVLPDGSGFLAIRPVETAGASGIRIRTGMRDPLVALR